MKNWMFCFVALVWVGFSNAQNITELKEARVGFQPAPLEMVTDGSNYYFKGIESFKGEFETNPIAYLDTHCDMELFVIVVEDKNYDEYMVNVKSSKGDLGANFDKEGNRIWSSFKLKNVLLPADLREQVYRDYKGWTMVKNVHVGKERNGVIRDEFYRIKFVKGNSTKTLKIDVTGFEGSEFASLN